MMKKIIILTNSFPPINSPATNRYTSFAKYLTEFGYEVTVVTPLWTQSSRDYLEKKSGFTTNSNVNRTSEKVDYPVYRVPFSGREELGESYFEKQIARISLRSGNYLLGNLENEMLKKVISICEAQDFDIIISGGLPSYLTDISKKIAKRYSIKWVCDYRDIIGQVPIQSKGYLDYYRQKFGRFLHITRDSFQTKTAVVKTCASQRISEVIFSNRINAAPVHVILNGFDPEDYNFDCNKEGKEKFTIIHGGTIYPFQRPEIFLKGLDLLINKHPYIKEKIIVKFFGQSSSYIAPFLKDMSSSSVIQQAGYVERKDLLKEIKNSDLILFLSAEDKGVTTSKIYECLASEVTIMSVPGDKDITSKMIKDANSGLDAETPEQVMKSLERLYLTWESGGKLAPSVDINYVNQFSRKEQARELAKVLEKL